MAFSFRHIPALWFAFANCGGAVMYPIYGTAHTIQFYGLPKRIADKPETWPVWEAGQGRTILLGLLMHSFYWRGEYAACDTLLMGVAFLGLNDFWVVSRHGEQGWAWFRLLGSIAFGATGYFGLTQGW